MTEHKCVLETAGYLARNGFRVDILPVGSSGLLDVATLEAAITEETCLVSIMTANNEIGVLQPIEDIAALCRSIEQPILLSPTFAAAAGKAKERLVSVGRYALRGVSHAQELFTVDPTWQESRHE